MNRPTLVEHRDTWHWHSPRLDRRMDVARWGFYGKPVILFPTAGGDFLECERFLMIHVLKPLIEAGRIKVYACGSISGDGWLDGDAHPAHKTWLQERFGAYVTHELLPFVARDSGGLDSGYCAAGASLGAYNALTAATRNPHAFDLCIAMSGTFEFDRWMDGHRDERYYHHQPSYFLPNLPEGPQLHAMRQGQFVIATGQGRAEAPDESRRIAATLHAKGVPTHLDVWGHDVHHDWPTWRTMLPMFLDRLVP